jgi:hypothetical protein
MWRLQKEPLISNSKIQHFSPPHPHMKIALHSIALHVDPWSGKEVIVIPLVHQITQRTDFLKGVATYTYDEGRIVDVAPVVAATFGLSLSLSRRSRWSQSWS